MRTTVATFVMGVGLAVAGASAQLVNPSFETPGAFSTFDGWNEYNNFIPNLQGSTDFARTGIASAKMFGGFAFPFNTSGVFQDLSGVQPGDVWRATVSGLTPTGDSIVGSQNFVFCSLVYLDNTIAGVPNLIDLGVNVVEGTSAADGFITASVEFVAPLGVTGAQINIGFVQPNFEGGAVWVDDASLVRVAQNQPIPFYNGSFEDGPAFGRTNDGWREFGNSIGNVLRLQRGISGTGLDIQPADGDFLTFIFGQFNGSATGNDSGTFQGVPASAGQTWEAGVQVRHDAADAIGAGNTAALSLQFLDAAGVILTDTVEQIADSTSPTNVWIPASVTATAPAGTAQARITLVYSQAAPTGGAGTEPTGAVWFDAATLAQAPSCPVDLNDDGNVNIFDIFAFFGAFGSGDLAVADFTNDGSLNIFDIFAFFNLFGVGC